MKTIYLDSQVLTTITFPLFKVGCAIMGGGNYSCMKEMRKFQGLWIPKILILRPLHLLEHNSLETCFVETHCLLLNLFIET
jgi:hypothetical protein